MKMFSRGRNFDIREHNVGAAKSSALLNNAISAIPPSSFTAQMGGFDFRNQMFLCLRQFEGSERAQMLVAGALAQIIGRTQKFDERAYALTAADTFTRERRSIIRLANAFADSPNLLDALAKEGLHFNPEKISSALRGAKRYILSQHKLPIDERGEKYLEHLAYSAVQLQSVHGICKTESERVRRFVVG